MVRPALSKPSSAQTNAPDLTVSELSNALKRTVEDRFGLVRVRGEISNYRGPHSSGHCYFCLKDETARIDAVVWKTAFQRMRVKPEEGLEVIATGKITTFPGKSSYQIVIESIEPAGIGALMALLEERRRMFAAEGLFDAARKKPLPYLPEVIGVVTSPTGAVIRDILHRVAGRFPRRVLVWPVRVQGETSAAEVACAIAGLNALAHGAALPRPSVIIVARGGGSLEDLWGFNDEALVRAAAASLIPLISAVGHETDWTLLDHVADVRAPTPTGAAEICVPVLADLLLTLADLARRHRAAMLRHVERQRADFRGLARHLPIAQDLLAVPRQRLDRAAERLLGHLAAGLRDRHVRLARAGQLLARHAPQAEFARVKERLAGLAKRLVRERSRILPERRQQLAIGQRRLATALAARLALERQRGARERERLRFLHGRLRPALATPLAARTARLAALGQLLNTLGHRQILARGFALVRTRDGEPIKAARAVAAGEPLNLEFADGTVAATADGDASAGAPERSRARVRRGEAVDQGRLF